MLTEKAIPHGGARSCGSLVNHKQLFVCIDFKGNLLLSSCVDGTEVLGEFSAVHIVE